MSNKKLKITTSELQSELERLRDMSRKYPMEMDQAIIIGRNNPVPVSYPLLAKYILEKFGIKVSMDFVRKRYVAVLLPDLNTNKTPVSKR